MLLFLLLWVIYIAFFLLWFEPLPYIIGLGMFATLGVLHRCKWVEKWASEQVTETVSVRGQGGRVAAAATPKRGITWSGWKGEGNAKKRGEREGACKEGGEGQGYSRSQKVGEREKEKEGKDRSTGVCYARKNKFYKCLSRQVGEILLTHGQAHLDILSPRISGLL